jgi:hypothetical protein
VESYQWVIPTTADQRRKGVERSRLTTKAGSPLRPLCHTLETRTSIATYTTTTTSRHATCCHSRWRQVFLHADLHPRLCAYRAMVPYPDLRRPQAPGTPSPSPSPSPFAPFLYLVDCSTRCMFFNFLLRAWRQIARRACMRLPPLHGLIAPSFLTLSHSLSLLSLATL